MPKIAYIERSFTTSSLLLIEACNEIIDRFTRQGYRLTLRQLYYQLVAAGTIPNEQRQYKRLSSILTNARLAGLVDWLAIEDRMRGIRGITHWECPWDIMDSAYRGYALDMWLNQPNRAEVWVEKDALSSVVNRACRPLDVDYLSCRGYVSASEMWVAAQRLAGYIECNDQEVTVFHLGDHDPSGMDMTRDIEERLGLLSGHPIPVERLALNMDQIRQYNPPPSPTKLDDVRTPGYVSRYGHYSWELDALQPQVIADIISEAVLPLRDDDLWGVAAEKEKEHKGVLLSHRDQAGKETDRWNLEEVVE